MAYPDTLDSFQTPGTSLDSPAHDELHTEVSTAMSAVQAELGLLPKGSDASVAARLASIAAAVGDESSAMADDWEEYTLVATNISTGTGSFKVWEKRIGKTCHVHADITFGAGGALGPGNPTFELPFTPAHDLATGTAVYIRFGLAARYATVYAAADKVVQFMWDANPSGLWEAGTPMDATENNQVAVDITYRTT